MRLLNGSIVLMLKKRTMYERMCMNVDAIVVNRSRMMRYNGTELCMNENMYGIDDIVVKH